MKNSKQPKPLKLFLTDKADCCKGHFCVSRYQADGRTVEHWSDHALCFTSAGTVLLGNAAARSKLEWVRDYLKKSPEDQRIIQLSGATYEVRAVDEKRTGWAYGASLTNQRVNLWAYGPSPELAVMQLGTKTAVWIQTGSLINI